MSGPETLLGLPAAPRPQDAATGASRSAPVALLDAISLGLTLLDGDARAIYANAAARQSLECGDAGLSLQAGRVAPVAPRLAADWRDALSAARAGRPMTVRLDAPGGRVGVSIGPAPQGAGVVCIMPAAGARHVRALRAYAWATRLTAAEAEVLEEIVSGGSPKAIARARGASESTVRAQVRSMLAKTGTRSLRELAIDVLRSAPAASPS